MKFRSLIENNINGKKVLIFFLLSNALYLVMLTITIPRVMHYSNGLKILDMMPAGYDAAYVNELFSKLGEPGRWVYLYGQIPFDLVYPAIYGIGFCLVMAWFLNKTGKLQSQLIFLCVLPVLAGLFDYCENFGIIIMLYNYPKITSGFVSLTNIFSIMKSIFTSIYFVILIFVIITFATQKLLRKRIN